MPHSDHQFRQWLAQAQQGEPAAITSLLRGQDAYLCAYVRRRLQRDLQPFVAVDDVLQELYLAAFKSIGRFTGRRSGELRAWLIGIAENKLREARKAHRAKKRGGGQHHRVEADRTTMYGKLVERVAHPGPTPSRIVAGKESRQHLGLALASLRPRDREAIELRFFRQLPLDAVAEHLAISPDAAKKRCHRALQRLRDFIQQDPRLSSHP